MKRQMIRLLLVLSFATVAVGCTKTINVEQQPYESRLALEGLLMPGSTPQIFLTKTVPFFTSDQTPSTLFVRDADLSIEGPDGVDLLVVDSTYNQFYCRYEPFYRGSIPIRFDASYHLRLTHSERLYEASTVTNIPAVTITHTEYVSEFVDIYGGHEGVIVDFDDIPGRADQYRFEMTRLLDNTHETVDEREYSSACLPDGEIIEVRDIGRFIYFDDRLDGAPVRFVVEPAHTHRKGDVAFLYIQSLDRAAADYYDRLDRQREANVNPFIEPVFLSSSIDGLIGVFGAMNRSPVVEFIFPEDAL